MTVEDVLLNRTRKDVLAIGAETAVGFRLISRRIGMKDGSDFINSMAIALSLLAFDNKGREIVNLDRLAEEEMVRCEETSIDQSVISAAVKIDPGVVPEVEMEAEDAIAFMFETIAEKMVEIEKSYGLDREQTIRAGLVAIVTVLVAEKSPEHLAENAEHVCEGIRKKVRLWKEQGSQLARNRRFDA